jgi:hypothetical protein
MPSLLELQRRFAGALLAPAGPPEAGLRIYRDTVFANWRNALGATFVVVRQLTGAPFFAAAVDAFALAHPSTGGDLNVYGAEFPGFLATYEHTRELPYLPDVARLEWAMDEAQRAFDETDAADGLLASLASIPPDAIPAQRFRLEASCRLLRSPFPVLLIWQAHQPGGDLQEVAFGGPDDLLLVRREEGRVSVERLAPGEFAWLAALAGRDDFASALDAAVASDPRFDLGAVLARRVADRTLAAIA